MSPVSHVLALLPPIRADARHRTHTRLTTDCKHGLCPVSINPLSPQNTKLYPNCTQAICSRDVEVMTVVVLGSMGNLCLHSVPAYEARTVADLASRVVEKQGKEQKVGDLEKLLGASCASMSGFLFRENLIDKTLTFDFQMSSGIGGK